MKPVKIIFLVIAFYLALTEVTLAQEKNELIVLYEQIKDVALDEEKVAEVESLILRRDAAVFRLNKGKICLFQPIQGKITGAVFVGEGVFELTPPTSIEKYQLQKFTKKEKLSEAFDELFMRFSDTTGRELESQLDFSKDEVPGKLTGIKNDGSGRLLDKTGRNLSFRILADILTDSSFRAGHPDRSDRFFYADVKTTTLGHFFFTFDPKKIEEVVLEKPPSGPLEERYDLVCSFHQAEDYTKITSSRKDTPIHHEDKDEIKVTHYRMEVEIKLNEELSAIAELDYEGLVDGARVIDFSLTGLVNVEKITDENGDSVAFGREKDQIYTTVILPQPTRAGKAGKLIFKYSGKVMDQNWYGDLYIRSSTYWYPHYGYLTRATYDLTFKCPGSYKLVSIGQKTDEWMEGDNLCTKWVEEVPVSAASFNYGNFKIYDLILDSVPPVSVYYLEDSHKSSTQDYNRFLANYSNVGVLLLGSKTKKEVAADVVNSLNFFQQIYGKCPFSKMSATEIPAEYGQGFPGLLHLAWGSYQGNLEEVAGFTLESFRAHEVSHQWWGHIVGWESYHDQWLSEGLAQYSGVWYAQLSTKNNELFFEEIERWLKDITGKGYPKSEGSKAGSLWLGRRLNSSESYDYTTLVYEKGAYVLHMLRNMMMDYDNKSDDRFQNMLADFVETYRGKNASTEDFKGIVEKHVEDDMDWFFDEWVYGVEIPTYVFSYTTEKTPEGKYVVKCEVTQENVSKDFKMWVPILLDFGGGQYTVLRLWVDKSENKYELPKAPMMPKQVIFNPFHSVLCEVKNK